MGFFEFIRRFQQRRHPAKGGAAGSPADDGAPSWAHDLEPLATAIQRRPPPRSVFVAYVRADEQSLVTLCKRLEPLEQSSDLNIWWDSLIRPGSEWDDAIRDKLRKADIVVFLVSGATPGSKYVCEKEVPEAIQASQQTGARVLPILLDESGRTAVLGPDPHPTLSRLSQFQTLPPDRALVQSNSDWDLVARGITETVHFQQARDILLGLGRAQAATVPGELRDAALECVFGRVPALSELTTKGDLTGESSLSPAMAHAILAIACMRSISSSGTGPLWAIHGLVPHAVHSDHDAVVELAARILTESGFFPSWVDSERDVEVLWRRLQALDDRVRSETLRNRLLDLHRFLAHARNALLPHPRDISSLFATWRSDRGLPLTRAIRETAHLPTTRARAQPTPMTVSSGALEWLHGPNDLLCSCAEGVHRFDAENLAWKSFLHPLRGIVARFRASPDGTRYLLIEGRATIRDARTDGPLVELEQEKDHLVSWDSVAWSPDGHRLFGTWGHRLFCWDAHSGRVLAKRDVPILYMRPIACVGQSLVGLTNDFDASKQGSPLTNHFVIINTDTLEVEVDRAIPIPVEHITRSCCIVPVPS